MPPHLKSLLQMCEPLQRPKNHRESGTVCRMLQEKYILPARLLFFRICRHCASLLQGLHPVAAVRSLLRVPVTSDNFPQSRQNALQAFQPCETLCCYAAPAEYYGSISSAWASPQWINFLRAIQHRSDNQTKNVRHAVHFRQRTAVPYESDFKLPCASWRFCRVK